MIFVHVSGIGKHEYENNFKKNSLKRFADKIFSKSIK